MLSVATLDQLIATQRNDPTVATAGSSSRRRPQPGGGATGGLRADDASLAAVARPSRVGAVAADVGPVLLFQADGQAHRVVVGPALDRRPLEALSWYTACNHNASKEFNY